MTASISTFAVFVYKVHVQNSQVQSFRIQSPLSSGGDEFYWFSGSRERGVNENCLEDSARAPPLRKIVM